ncbi:hypothetical protein QR680_014810 [Steinernema hermaphroditum]|uniref:F-box domain-containing protein n=1 Tax=Steinernema hermaphroditum TaxID=289476 RepID=A0AA39M4W7_9BILA|nr:hypothetical protein QR680_014810 [Steinernema hermaphroditum]
MRPIDFFLSKLPPNRRGAFHSKQHLPFNFQSTSNELLVKILKNLDTKSLADCRLVIRKWNSVIIDLKSLKFKPLIVEISDMWKSSVRISHLPSGKIYDQFHPSHLHGLSNLSFDEITYEAIDLKTLLPIVALPQTDDLKEITVELRGSRTPPEEIAELWRTLMGKPNLQSASIDFHKYFPTSIFRSQDRGDLPKLWDLDIKHAKGNADDILHLKNRVAKTTTIEKAVLHSDDDLLNIIENALRTPVGDLSIWSIPVSDFHAIKARLNFPDLEATVNVTDNLCIITKDKSEIRLKLKKKGNYISIK